MTLLKDAVEDKKFDIRLMEKNLQRGVIRQEDVQKSVKDLPDDAANVKVVDLNNLDNG